MNAEEIKSKWPKWYKCSECPKVQSEYMLVQVDGVWLCRACAAKKKGEP